MASWDDVRRIALALPEATEERSRELLRWSVRGRMFAWERPLRDADRRALGEAAPPGPILGARVEHVGAKEALIATAPEVYFTTPHFEGYAAVLVRLEEIAADDLEELLVDAWLARAPARLAREFLRAHPQGVHR